MAAPRSLIYTHRPRPRLLHDRVAHDTLLYDCFACVAHAERHEAKAERAAAATDPVTAEIAWRWSIARAHILEVTRTATAEIEYRRGMYDGPPF